jgi:ubiquinone/menaquinone biosynthesis C-methylase UbiE
VSEQRYLPAAGRDWLLPFYDPLNRLLGSERSHRRLLAQAAIMPGARVLEIGCGTGNLTILAKRLQPGADVVGTDPDPKALARARRKAQSRGLTIQFAEAFAQRLPFPDGSFDVVLSAMMLHHIPRDVRLEALREARRVLRPAGSLHVVDFAGGAAGGGLHGLIARLVHGTHGSSAHQNLLDLMAKAGLAKAREVALQSGIVGRVAYYEASV